MASADILRAAHIELPYQVLNSDPATIISVKCNRQEYYVARCYQNANPDVDGEFTAAFIVRACNAHYQMLEALKATRALVSEAALTGFNWQDGDWTTKLFENQAKLSAAIAAAEVEAGR